MKWLELLKDFYKTKPFTEKYKGDEFKVFVSVFLSSRTNDKITELVCDNLFKRVSSFEDILKINTNELEEMISKINFYKTKTKNLKKASEIIVKKYNSKLPDYNGLVKLPGVGPKIASVILNLTTNSTAIAVDTHVHRICNRIGIVETYTPMETKRELEKIIDKKYWSDLNPFLVVHGQNICRPNNPLCDRCPIKMFCKKYEFNLKFNKIIESLNFKKVNNLIDLRKKYGTYLLYIRLNHNKTIQFSKNKKHKFKKGYYIYVGSAAGEPIDLYTRLKRHTSKNKKEHWHIDKLLKYGKICSIYYSFNHIECSTAKKFLENNFKYVHGFGCSDCSCLSHLFFIPD